MEGLPFMFLVFIKRLSFTLVGLAVITLIWANRTGRLELPSYQGKGKLTPVTEATPWPDKTITVTIGAWVEDISNFTVSAQTFNSNGTVWFTWPQEFQTLLEARQIPVESFFTIANALSDYTVAAVYDKPLRLPDGRYYQAFQYSGTFFAYGLNFRRFPFQVVRLPIGVTINAEKFAADSSRVRLVPDRKQTGVGEYVHLPGYVTNGLDVTEWIYEFGTHFGLPAELSGEHTIASRVEVGLLYHKSVVASLLKLLLPLIVVMTVVLLAPSLAGSLWDVRIALPSTALLTLVFLQQSYADQLPPLPYITFLDQIYALCYATALAFFALFVWSSNQLDTSGENRASVVQRINRVDHTFQVTFSIALVVLIILSWFFPVR